MAGGKGLGFRGHTVHSGRLCPHLPFLAPLALLFFSPPIIPTPMVFAKEKKKKRKL